MRGHLRRNPRYHDSCPWGDKGGDTVVSSAGANGLPEIRVRFGQNNLHDMQSKRAPLSSALSTRAEGSEALVSIAAKKFCDQSRLARNAIPGNPYSLAS